MTSALATFLAHAERQRDVAQAALSAAEQHAVRLFEQGRQLTDYRTQCRRDGPIQPGRVTGIDALRAHQALLERIDQALGQQTRRVSDAEGEIARRREALLALELRVAAVRQLLARRAALTRLTQDRREQRQADDAVQGQSLARSRSAPADPAVPAF